MTHKKWIKLSPEERRIKVAECCGWERLHMKKPDEALREPNGIVHYFADEHGLNLPDYLNDLNLMHEVENSIHNKSFDNSEWLSYLHNLDKVIHQRRAHATAAHRAEAFVLTMEPEDET